MSEILEAITEISSEILKKSEIQNLKPYSYIFLQIFFIKLQKLKIM